MKRIAAIEYIRGICMLGVVAIHTGGYSLSNPDVNVHEFAALEIFTRFSIPLFFFISGFGLFIRQPDTPFRYREFLLRRGRSVFIPYVVWSFLYMAHYTLTTGDYAIWKPGTILTYGLYGLASYQLYFLVILLGFYLFMPVWRWTLHRLITPRPLWTLMLLLFLQIAFNYYSCYVLKPDFDNELLNQAIQNRFSWLVLHYVFIFLFGAYFAVQFSAAQSWIARHQAHIAVFFTAALGSMLLAYYYVLAQTASPEAAVNTIQQLNPLGVIYTLAAALFWFMLFDRPLSRPAAWVLSRLAKHSYPIYLLHPLVMFYLTDFLGMEHWRMTPIITFGFWLSTVIISLCGSWVIQSLSRFIPLAGLLLTGKEPIRQKPHPLNH